MRQYCRRICWNFTDRSIVCYAWFCSSHMLLRNNLCSLGCHSILSCVWHWHNIPRLDRGALATPVTCNLRTPVDLGLTTFVAIGIILVIGIWYWATHIFCIYLSFLQIYNRTSASSFCSNQIIFCPQSSNHPSEAVSRSLSTDWVSNVC